MKSFKFCTSICLIAMAQQVSAVFATELRSISTDPDESSCICGLSKDLMDRLESILRLSLQNQSCSQEPHTEVSQAEQRIDHDTTESPQSLLPDSSSSVEMEAHKQSVEEEHQSESQEVDTNLLASELHRLEMMLISSRPQKKNDSSSQILLGSNNGGTKSNISTLSSNFKSNHHGELTVTISHHRFDTGYLDGLQGSTPSHQLLDKLNSSQSVNSEDVTNALTSTIISVVSNIFKNIQNITEETRSEPGSASAGGDNLTSIDGSSVNVTGISPAEITAEGEKLFLAWVEHQLGNLHLTSAMAAYIRKNAVNLFRRIVNQYVERMEKLGGSIENNVRRATQVALSNTQHLTAFMLKNYVNFAGGILKILGEQVSRVGKQLDSTGDSISHLSLNPFDIVSNMIGSLPDPTKYSEYFRNIGKQLLRDFEKDVGTSSEMKEVDNITPAVAKEDGLIRRTFGALTKSVSWLG